MLTKAKSGCWAENGLQQQEQTSPGYGCKDKPTKFRKQRQNVEMKKYIHMYTFICSMHLCEDFILNKKIEGKLQCTNK